MSITLSGLTTTIIAEVPTLFEDVMNQEISNSVMFDHCSELKNQIELTKESIENEREKQRQLRNHLLKIRGPITMSSRSISLGSGRMFGQFHILPRSSNSSALYSELAEHRC